LELPPTIIVLMKFMIKKVMLNYYLVMKLSLLKKTEQV
jgi:hypothetical protein